MNVCSANRVSANGYIKELEFNDLKLGMVVEGAFLAINLRLNETGRMKARGTLQVGRRIDLGSRLKTGWIL
jgi:hypothetical protein